MGIRFIERAVSTTATPRPYLLSLAMVAAVTAFGLVLGPVLRTENVDTLFLLATLVSALEWGQGPGIATAIVSGVVFDYCFVPPRFSFHTSDLPYLVTLIGFVIIAVATSTLASRARQLTASREARARAEAHIHAKDEVLNKISHELRAPVNAALGWAQLASRTMDEPERLVRSLTALQHSMEMVARLADDLLSASRVASGKFPVELRPVALAPVLTKAVDVMMPAAEEHGVYLDTMIQSAGTVIGDAQRLEQIVINLLGNAIKFTPRDGRVVVRLTVSGSHAEIEVSDTGPGIPADFLPHVFEQFSQADARGHRGGLGLGLAITKHLVEAHRGSVDVTSPGKAGGTTVTVRLRCVDAPQATFTADAGSNELTRGELT